MAIVLGIDLDEEVPDLFDSAKPGRLLLLDGDFACYRASANAKTLPTAYRRWVTEVLADAFLAQAELVEVHLTAAGGAKAHRDLYPSWKPYQGNRKGKAKPPLLEPLRQFLAQGPEDLPPNIEIVTHYHWEADDGLIMKGEIHGHTCVVKSDDKDLNMTRAPLFNMQTGQVDYLRDGDRYGWVKDAYTESGILKATGHGTRFFWTQMLMGDTADHIRGLDKWEGKNIGIAGALDVMQGIDCEHEAANRVLWAYAKIGQDALAEAELLWLRRNEEDSAAKYLQELDLDTGLRTWVQGLASYHQQILDNHLRVEE